MATAQEMIEHLRKNPKAVEQLMRSPDGMRLMQMLSAKDGGTGLKNAAAAAQKGNTEQMAKLVQNMMTSKEGKALAERIQKTLGAK